MARKQKPSSSPESKENRVIAMAYDLAEKQIREGTASAQVITHFLKMGSTKEREERETLKEQRRLLATKRESIEHSRQMDKLLEDAVRAMKTYSGNRSDDEDEDI